MVDRTTVSIPRDVLAAAKIRAKKFRMGVSGYITRLIEQDLNDPSKVIPMIARDDFTEQSARVAEDPPQQSQSQSQKQSALQKPPAVADPPNHLDSPSKVEGGASPSKGGRPTLGKEASVGRTRPTGTTDHPAGER